MLDVTPHVRGSAFSGRSARAPRDRESPVRKLQATRHLPLPERIHPRSRLRNHAVPSPRSRHWREVSRRRFPARKTLPLHRPQAAMWLNASLTRWLPATRHPAQRPDMEFHGDGRTGSRRTIFWRNDRRKLVLADRETLALTESWLAALTALQPSISSPRLGPLSPIGTAALFCAVRQLLIRER